MMAKKVLIVKNMAHEGPGLLELSLLEHGIAWHYADLSAGDPFPDPRNFPALVVLGGHQSANDKTSSMQLEIRRIEEALGEEIPYLGICLGIQTLVKAGGGTVVKASCKETGFIDPQGNPYRVELTEAGKSDPLFKGLGSTLDVFQLHGERVELTPSGMELLATGSGCRNQAVRVGKNGYGLQCHFELTREMFESWCRIDPDLKQMDYSELMAEFDRRYEEYTATGMKLMENFLRISGLV